MHKHIMRILIIALSMLPLIACGTLEVGIERTPAPDYPSTVGPEPTDEPTVWLTPTPHMDTWDTYINPVFGISLEYPTTWQPVDGYSSPETGEVRYAGVNGFFHISAMGADSLDEAAASEAEHVLQPYGSRPIIENLWVQNQDARLILPSVDQPAGMDRQAALIVTYPSPVDLSGYAYPYFLLWADMEHIRTIAQTLDFTESPTAIPTTTVGELESACSYGWFLSNPPSECPGEPPQYSITVAQRFERGMMLWREQPGHYDSQIYIFYTDGVWPEYDSSNELWHPGWPESDPSIIPPSGYYQPVRGFGIMWRERSYSGLSVRNRLGWAIEEEFSVGELPLQCTFEDDRPTECYLVGPENVVYYVFLPENSWSTW